MVWDEGGYWWVKQASIEGVSADRQTHQVTNCIEVKVHGHIVYLKKPLCNAGVSKIEVTWEDMVPIALPGCGPSHLYINPGSTQKLLSTCSTAIRCQGWQEVPTAALIRAWVWGVGGSGLPYHDVVKG